MCLLPPNCLFCRHYHLDARHDEPDCAAFDEIPDEIFVGGNEHRDRVAGDRGLRFTLDPDMAEEYEEVCELRREIAALAD